MSKQASASTADFTSDRGNTLANEVDRLCQELLQRPIYSRGPFVIPDEELQIIDHCRAAVFTGRHGEEASN